MKKIKTKKNKLLYLLIFTHIRPYSLIFAHIRYFLQSAREVRIGVLVKCWNSYVVFLQSSEVKKKKTSKKQKTKPKNNEKNKNEKK